MSNRDLLVIIPTPEFANKPVIYGYPSIPPNSPPQPFHCLPCWLLQIFLSMQEQDIFSWIWIFLPHPHPLYLPFLVQWPWRPRGQNLKRICTNRYSIIENSRSSLNPFLLGTVSLRNITGAVCVNNDCNLEAHKKLTKYKLLPINSTCVYQLVYCYVTAPTWKKFPRHFVACLQPEKLGPITTLCL